MFYADTIDQAEYSMDNIISQYTERCLELEESWQELTERRYKYQMLYEQKYNSGYYQEAMTVYNEGVKDVMRKLADWGRTFLENIRKLIDSMVDWFTERLGIAERLSKELDNIDANETQSRNRSFEYTDQYINILNSGMNFIIDRIKEVTKIDKEELELSKEGENAVGLEKDMVKNNSDRKFNIKLTKNTCEKCLENIRNIRNATRYLQDTKRSIENESREFIRLSNDEKNYKEVNQLKRSLNSKVSIINKCTKSLAKRSKVYVNYVKQFIRECKAQNKIDNTREERERAKVEFNED